MYWWATPFCSFAERIGRELLSDSYNVKISHRDKDRRKEGMDAHDVRGNTEPSEEERPENHRYWWRNRAPVLLRNLRKRDADVTAIVTVADDGGSSGIIRDYMNVVPPGDIRNRMIALSPMNAFTKRNLPISFQFRRPIPSLDMGLKLNHCGPNRDAWEIFSTRFSLLAVWMAVEGRVYPAAEEPLLLRAEFQDGTIVDGKRNLLNIARRLNEFPCIADEKIGKLDEKPERQGCT